MAETGGLFIRIESPAIKGGATSEGYKEDIAIDYWSWGLSNVTEGQCAINEVIVNKRFDQSSPVLMTNCALGNEIGKIQIFNINTGEGGAKKVFYRIELRGAKVTSISLDKSGDGVITETISFAAKEYFSEYEPYEKDTKEAHQSFGWNVKDNEELAL